ncbi:MAG: STAS domain-containing protein [Planctomycetes bacterium]|nr:STAS domain-containing protein [Planctomycetota bacterium]
MAEVLVISNENRDLNLLLTALRAQALEVCNVKNAKEAFRHLRIRLPDLIIAEQELEDETGVELLKQIKDVFREEAPPFILMCHLSVSHAAGLAIREGAINYLPRPVDIREATRMVARALGQAIPDRGPETPPAIESDSDVLILHFPSHLDYESAMHLSSLVNSDFVDSKRGVIIDLKGTAYIASAGIGVLHQLAYESQHISDKLFISGASERIAKILESVGLLHFYKPVASETEALAQL